MRASQLEDFFGSNIEDLPFILDLTPTQAIMQVATDLGRWVHPHYRSFDEDGPQLCFDRSMFIEDQNGQSDLEQWEKGFDGDF